MYIMVDLQHHALSHILTICVMVKTWIWVWVKIRYPLKLWMVNTKLEHLWSPRSSILTHTRQQCLG